MTVTLDRTYQDVPFGLGVALYQDGSDNLLPRVRKPLSGGLLDQHNHCAVLEGRGDDSQ